MSDVTLANQLTSGFYPMEGTGWRWTSRRFSVALGLPPDSRVRGALLEVDLYVPQTQIDALGPVILISQVDDCPLGTAIYQHEGKYVYVANVPATTCVTNALAVDFSVNGSGPVEGESTARGLVISSISLHTK